MTVAKPRVGAAQREAMIVLAASITCHVGNYLFI
jgi:hypothetical protein